MSEWNEYAKLVQHEMARAHDRLDRLDVSMTDNKDALLKEIHKVSKDLGVFMATVNERARNSGIRGGIYAGIIVNIVGGLILARLLGG